MFSCVDIDKSSFNIALQHRNLGQQSSELFFKIHKSFTLQIESGALVSGGEKWAAKQARKSAERRNFCRTS